MAHPLLDDEWIRAKVDAAVAPFVGAFDEARLAWMRDQLAETLSGNPEAAKLVRRAHPRPVDASEEIAADVDIEAEAEARSKPDRSA